MGFKDTGKLTGWRKESARHKANRVKFQLRIREKFGQAMIDEYREKYCRTCRYIHGCLLLPITAAGDPCPYHEATNQGSERPAAPAT